MRLWKEAYHPTKGVLGSSPQKILWKYAFIWWLFCHTVVNNSSILHVYFHPGLAEIPAHVGSQKVVDTPTNAHCWLVNIYLGVGRVLQLVHDRSHLINATICIYISRVGCVTRACMVGGMSRQKRLHLLCHLKPLYWTKFNEFLIQKLQGPVLHIGLWKCRTHPSHSYCLEGWYLYGQIFLWPYKKVDSASDLSSSQAYIKKRRTPIQVFLAPNAYTNSFIVCSCILCILSVNCN